MSSKHAPRAANPVDVHVGARIRLRRQVLKMSQEKLGDQLGVTFQQVQKYERGTNRVGASRLWRLSQVLDVPVSFFFEGLEGGAKGEDAAAEAIPADLMGDKEALDLIRSYYAIPEHQRRRLFELARVLSDVA